MEEFKDVQPSEIAIEGLMKGPEVRPVALFKALIRGRRCVLKVV